MRHLKIFLLYVQDVLEYRSLAFVYFLISIVNPLLYLAFWRGAVGKTSTSEFTSISDVTSYYFLFLIFGGLIMTHIEEEVAYWDVKEGGLVKFILKPFPYITSKFFLEFTWRLFMFFLSIVGIIILSLFFGQILAISITPLQLLILIVMSALGLIISFIFKMMVGLSALWIIEYSGMQQFIFVLTLLFSGYIVPIEMFPSYLRSISSVLPFQYMVYYPVRLLQGKLSLEQIVTVIGIQLLWLLLLTIGYKFLWAHGIKRFSGVGL